jgi:hypothetical protein
MKCRGRNLLQSKIEGYYGPECRHCGHQRFYLDRRRQWRTDYCTCDGYHYKHRAGSPFCMLNPNYEFNVRTRRYGEDPAEVQLDLALKSEVQPDDKEGCPF